MARSALGLASLLCKECQKQLFASSLGIGMSTRFFLTFIWETPMLPQSLTRCKKYSASQRHIAFHQWEGSNDFGTGNSNNARISNCRVPPACYGHQGNA